MPCYLLVVGLVVGHIGWWGTFRRVHSSLGTKPDPDSPNKAEKGLQCRDYVGSECKDTRRASIGLVELT